MIWQIPDTLENENSFLLQMEMERITCVSTFISTRHHQYRLKENYSAGDQRCHLDDERQTSSDLSVRGSVHFLPPDFIKRRFMRLSPEDHSLTGKGRLDICSTEYVLAHVDIVLPISACFLGIFHSVHYFFVLYSNNLLEICYLLSSQLRTNGLK